MSRKNKVNRLCREPKKRDLIDMRGKDPLAMSNPWANAVIRSVLAKLDRQERRKQ